MQTAVRYYNYNKRKGIVKLEMVHVQGAFAILVAGNIISIAIFCTELVYFKFASNHVTPKSVSGPIQGYMNLQSFKSP